MPLILTVDDSASIRKMVEFALKSRGHTVVTADDGQEALELLERGDLTPDLIVLDVNMPRLDGLSLLQLIREHPAWAALPILMLTTEGQDADRERALTLGATEYMVKPFKPTELIERISQLLAAPR